MSLLKKQVEKTAKEAGVSELEIITAMQAISAQKGDESTLEALASLKWDYIDSMESIIYYIQEQTPGLDWENTPSQAMTFPARSHAVKFCQDLSKYSGREVRLTSEASDNGAYFRDRKYM